MVALRSFGLRGLVMVALSVGCGGSTTTPTAPEQGEIEAADLSVTSNDGASKEPVTAGSAPAPKPSRDDELESWRRLRLDVGERKRRGPTQKTPCVLSGSAVINDDWTRLYIDATGSTFHVTLKDFDVVALELPERSGERPKISIDFPFRASGYLEWYSPIVSTAWRIDLVEDHVYLEPGTVVHAFRPVAGMVSITHTATPSIKRDAFEKSTPRVARRVPCTDIGLTKQRPPTSTRDEVYVLSGSVALHTAPNGPAIGRVVRDNIGVHVLERRSGWSRVISAEPDDGFDDLPYQFDAWVPEGLLGRGSRTTIIVRSPPRTPSGVTTALLPLRLVPDAAAPVVVRLEPGVAILTGSEQGGLLRLRINEALGNNAGNDFWVTSADLEANTAPFQGPAR